MSKTPVKPMPFSTLVIGGCRSGKSRTALTLADQTGYIRKTFIATCVPSDPEMQDRVNRHQQERGKDWVTVEAPVNLADAIVRAGKRSDVILVDCLTLWASNLMNANRDPNRHQRDIDELVAVVAAPSCPVILVTNEVGTGIVPENRLARRFRDLTGWINQAVAGACQQVIMTVAGIPVIIKPSSGVEPGPINSGAPV